MRGASKRPVQILLVEDNPGDVRLTEEVLRDAKIATKLSTVRDGEEAMAFVRREGAHAGAPRPDLILLDLNLPRKDGREVLNELKSDDELRRIPVIVLTTSMAEPDILMSYDLHANCYIHKPIEFEEFSTAINSIQQFWLLTVQLPPS
jgi:two-component system, chemotaxis family, response regulator Rcp1